MKLQYSPPNDAFLHGAHKLPVSQGVARGALLFMLLYFFDLVETVLPICEVDRNGDGVPDIGGACIDASALNRFVLTSAFVAAAFIMIVKLPLTLAVLRRAWPVALLAAWFLASSIWAAYPELTRTRSIAVMVAYLACLGLAIGFRSPRVLGVTFLTAAALVMFADLISLAFPTYSDTEIGVRGIHKHKNMAGLIASLTMAGILCSLSLRSPLARHLTIILGIWCLVFLYFTKSKTNLGIVAVIIALIPLYLLLVRSESPRFWHMIATGAICTLLFVAGASGTKLSFFGEALFGDATLTNRMVIWAAVEQIIAQSPWFGQGFGSFWDVGQDYNPFPSDGYVYYNDAKVINESHNGYIDLMLHGGRIALVLGWIVAVRGLWFSLVLATSRQVTRQHRWAFCMLHCIMIIMLVNNLSESSVFFPGGHFFYVFLIVVAQVERWKAEFDAYRRMEILNERPPADRGQPITAAPAHVWRGSGA